MYVILVHDDNTLSAPKKERIMQRSKMVDELWFLSHPMYKGFDMTNCTVLLEYVLPISKRYKTEILTKSNDMYEDHLKYTLPFDTELTVEHGEIELQLSFILADLDVNGKPIQRVRKVDAIKINIVPTTAWSNLIPDDALTALDQRIIKMDAQIKELNDTAKQFNESKADNITYNSENNEIQLMAGTKLIGNKITLVECDCKEDEEEFSVVLF